MKKSEFPINYLEDQFFDLVKLAMHAMIDKTLPQNAAQIYEGEAFDAFAEDVAASAIRLASATYLAYGKAMEEMRMEERKEQ